MSFLSNHDHSNAAVDRPDLFASLTEGKARRGRPWFFNLMMEPFKDQDERATYHVAGQVSDARRRAGILAKAWNGNGIPVAHPPRSVGF